MRRPHAAVVAALAAVAPCVLARRADAQPVVAAGTPAAPAPSEEAPEVAEAARRLFREGVEFAQDERWEDARSRFRAALSLHPSALGRFNLATAARNSGHFVEAVDQYRQFLRDDRDPLNGPRRREAQAAIDAIEPVLARVTVMVRGPVAPTALRLDGRPLPLALVGIEAPMDPGDHVFEVDGAAGAWAHAQITLNESEARTVTLVLEPPPHGTGAATARAVPREQPRPVPRRRAPVGTIERVRRAILERASATDLQGRRRWDRTIVVYAMQGTGTPVGVFGAGLRFDARPWIGFEAQVGAGHPFGPGIALAIDPRLPLSYRYALGFSLAFATNFTTLDPGTVAGCTPAADGSAPFTPAWLMAAVTHEWRATPAVAFRLALGVRWLVNAPELANATRAQCVAQRTAIAPLDVAFDPPTLDHTVFPVLPWIAFDVGWSP